MRTPHAVLSHLLRIKGMSAPNQLADRLLAALKGAGYVIVHRAGVVNSEKKSLRESEPQA